MLVKLFLIFEANNNYSPSHSPSKKETVMLISKCGLKNITFLICFFLFLVLDYIDSFKFRYIFMYELQKSQ